MKHIRRILSQTIVLSMILLLGTDVWAVDARLSIKGQNLINEYYSAISDKDWGKIPDILL